MTAHNRREDIIRDSIGDFAQIFSYSIDWFIYCGLRVFSTYLCMNLSKGIRDYTTCNWLVSELNFDTTSFLSLSFYDISKYFVEVDLRWIYLITIG